jgi:hypothetical protein
MSERMESVNAPRVVLDQTRALAWLKTLEAVSAGTSVLPAAYESPSSYDLVISADWSPRDSVDASVSEQGHMVVDLENLLRAALELGFLQTLDGVEVLYTAAGRNMYQWWVEAPRYANLRLSSPMALLESIGLGGVYGAEQALAVLTEAVDEANILLEALFIGASTVVADYTDDPTLLTRLAGSDERMVRAAALANPAAPEEAHVLAALREQ